MKDRYINTDIIEEEKKKVIFKYALMDTDQTVKIKDQQTEKKKTLLTQLNRRRILWEQTLQVLFSFQSKLST